jgi:predicted ferric reductase
MITYNYLLKLTRFKHQPFILKEVTRVSCNDWQVRVEKQQGDAFYFEARQFVWLNTSSSVHGVDEHTFSIASFQNDLPKTSFIIKEPSDYNRNLDSLTLGQQVYIDSYYGSMSLNDSKHAKGTSLIEGGAGIGPMLILLQGLVSARETRPVRLINGNNSLEKLFC